MASLPIAPPSQIGLSLTRTPALPELAAARTELARRPDATSQFNIGGEIDGTASAEAAQPAAPESFKRFEAMVLQTFIQNMLPEDGAAVYGKGMAGEMWKSLLAEKMAGAMAERGGIGIADRMLGERYATTAKAENAALPTDIGEIAKINGTARTGSRFDISPAVLDGMQRSLSELLGNDDLSPPEPSTQSTIKRG